MENIYWAIALFCGIVGGVAFGYQFRKILAVKRRDRIETKVESLINEAKAKQKEILLEANDKALKIIEESKQEERQRQQELVRTQKRLEQRESLFDQKLLDLENKKQDILEKVEKVERVKQEINKIKEEQIAKLEKIANLTREEAKKVLLDNTEKDIKEDLVHRIKKLTAQSNEELEKKARDLITLAVQPCAVSHSA